MSTTPSLSWRGQLRQRLGVKLKPPRRLKFTREGKYFTGMTLLVGFGAINTGNNLLYLLLGMMLALIILSGVLSETVLQKLKVRRKLPDRLFAGQPALVELKITNEKPRAATYSIQVLDRIEGVKSADRPGVYFMRLDAGATETSQYRYAFKRRGRFLIEGVEVATRFPFHLFLKSRDLDERDVAVVVFPDPIDPPPLRSRAAELTGDVSRHRVGLGGDFHGLRDHREGDDARNIHWKTTARRGEVITKEFEEEEARAITVCLDHRTDAGDDAEVDLDAEHAIRVAAGLCRDFLARGYAVGLSTLGGTVRPGTGPGHLDRIFHELAVLDLDQGDDGAFHVVGGANCVVVGALPSHPAVLGGRVLEHMVVAAPPEEVE